MKKSVKTRRVMTFVRISAYFVSWAGLLWCTFPSVPVMAEPPPEVTAKIPRATADQTYQAVDRAIGYVQAESAAREQGEITGVQNLSQSGRSP